MCKSFCGLLSRLLNKESKDKWKAAAFHLSLLNVRYKIVQNFERFGGGVFGCGPDHNLSWLQGGWSTPYIVSPASFPPPEPKGPPLIPQKGKLFFAYSRKIRSMARGDQDNQLLFKCPPGGRSCRSKKSSSLEELNSSAAACIISCRS